jgi:hypothetical protein
LGGASRFERPIDACELVPGLENTPQRRVSLESNERNFLSHFGDLSLLLGERRTASARATGYCDLLVLPKTEFERIKLDYPEFRDALKSLSSERSKKVSALVLSGAVL